MNGFRLRLAACAAATVMGVSGAAQAACQLDQLTELKVTMVGLRPTVHVTLNGQDAVFLVDSGAFYSTIAEGELARFGLTREPGASIAMQGVGGSHLAGATVIKSFVLGDVGLGRREILAANGMGPGVSGLIGQDILNILDTEFDLANGAIRILKAKGCGRNDDLAYWAAGQDNSVPMVAAQSSRDYTITAYAKLNGRETKALFDTGASISGINAKAAARAGVTPASPGVVQGGGTQGFGARMVKTWTAPFQSFALGGEEIRNPRIEVIDTDSDQHDMLVGADFFLSHRVLVSQFQRRIYFTYNGGPVFAIRGPRPVETAAQNAAPASADGEAPDADALVRRAAASMSRRDFKSAIADLDRAVAMKPDVADYYATRATARLASGQAALAMADITKAVELKPGDPDILLRRSSLYFSLQDKTRARADVVAAEAMKSADPHLPLRVAQAYLAFEDYDAGLSRLDSWIKDHPNDGELPNALNTACWNRALAKRELDVALAECTKAIRLRPGAAAYLDSRAMVRLDRGEFDLAIADYESALKIQKQPITLYARGVAKTRKGLKADGEADMREAVTLNARVADQARRYGLTP